MCGIFSLLNFSRDGNKSINKEFIINEFMKGKKRGPENSVMDTVSIDLEFGFHRLAINGLNNTSNQPIKINNIILICNGEIYNYKELYEDLGIEKTTDSDCEIIIHLYEKYGIDYTLEILDGVFAFSLLDNNPEETKLFIARDPYGVRPLYKMYKKDKEKVYAFASEMKMMNNICDKLDDNYIIEHFKPGTYEAYYYPHKVFSKWKFEYSKIYFKMGFSSTRYNYKIKDINLDDDIMYRNILSNIRLHLTNSVYKRCECTERPIACLLSGGLDSSLITALVCEYRKRNNLGPVETYSIGMKGSTDLGYADLTARYLGTNHTTIELSEEDFIKAIPEVIYSIESYDTTTVRASIGNYLISKYISENSEAKVIFNGDGSDELTGGYLYLNKAPNKIEFDRECRRLLQDIHKYDVLRSDKSISSNGLEPRTPFLDKSFTQYYLSLPQDIRYLGGKNKFFEKYKNIEKFLLRAAFDSSLSNSLPILPETILWRRKEAFSDGVSQCNRSLNEIIEEYIDKENLVENRNHIFNMPKTKEQMYYRNIFEDNYKDKSNIIPYFWMPKFVKDVNDPSARKLEIYQECNYKYKESSL